MLAQFTEDLGGGLPRGTGEGCELFVGEPDLDAAAQATGRAPAARAASVVAMRSGTLLKTASDSRCSITPRRRPSVSEIRTAIRGSPSRSRLTSDLLQGTGEDVTVADIVSGGALSPFEKYVVPEIPVLYRVGFTLTRQHDDAEDLVQETLIRAYRAIDRFDGAYPRAWLLTILRHTHLNRLRRPALS